VFSDPLVCALTLHKGMAKHVVRDNGIATADFAVVGTLSDLQGVQLPYPLFVKPIAEGTGKGVTSVSRVTSPEALAGVCRSLLERYRQPVLVETYLPGREFTVAITGTGRNADVLRAMEVHFGPPAHPGIY